MDTSDQAMLKHMRLVHFRSWFHPNNPTYINRNPLKIYPQIPKFIEKLKTPEHGNALISMLALAARRYQLDNLMYHIPQQIKDAISNYSGDSFVHAEFIQDLCKLGPDEKIISSDLHKHYVNYTGIKAHSNQTFKKNMEKRFEYKRYGNPYYYYYGINIDINKVNERNAQAASEMAAACGHANNNKTVALWRQSATQKHLDTVSPVKLVSPPDYYKHPDFIAECHKNQEKIPAASETGVSLAAPPRVTATPILTSNIQLTTVPKAVDSTNIITPVPSASLAVVCRAQCALAVSTPIVPTKIITPVPTPKISVPVKVSTPTPIKIPTPVKVSTPTPIKIPTKVSAPMPIKIPIVPTILTSKPIPTQIKIPKPISTIPKPTVSIKPNIGSIVKTKEALQNPPGTVSI